MAFDSVFCQVHQIQITSYCESCKDGICWKCFKLHKGHKVYALQYIFPKYQAIAMNEILPKIYRETKDLENIHNGWETTKHSVEKSIDNFQKGLTKQLNSIILALCRKEKTLMAMMKESRSKAISQCEREISHANKLQNNLEDLKLDAYNIAYSGTSSSVLGYKDLKMNLMSVDEEILKCLQNKKSSLKDQLCDYETVNIEELLKAVENLNLRERKEEFQDANKHRQTEEKRKKEQANSSRKRKLEGADLDKESNSRNKTAKKDGPDYSQDPFHDKKQSVSESKKFSALKSKLSNKKRLKSKDLYNAKQLHRKKDMLNAKTKAKYVDHDRMKDEKAKGSAQFNYTFQRPTVFYDDFEMFADSFASNDILSKEQDFSFYQVYKNIKNKNNDNRKNVQVNEGNQRSQETIKKTNQSEKRKDNQQKFNVSAKLSHQKSKVHLNDKSDLGFQPKVAEHNSDLEKNQDIQNKSEIPSDKYTETKADSSVKTVNNIQSAVQTIKLVVQSNQSDFKSNQSAVQSKQSEVQTKQSAAQSKQPVVHTIKLAIQSNQSEVQSKQSAAQSNQSEVQTKQSAAQSNQSEVQTKQSAAQSNQSEVQTKQSTEQSNQSEVQTKQSAEQSNQSAVHSNQSEVQTKQSTVHANQSVAQSKKSTVQTNQLAVQAKQSTVHANQSARQAKQSTVQSNPSQVHYNQSTVQSNLSTDSTIQSNKSAEQTNQSAVQSYQSTVQSSSGIKTEPGQLSVSCNVTSLVELTNQSAVQSNQSAILTNQVQSNQSTVQTNKSAILTNQSEGQSNQSTVQSFASSIKTEPGLPSVNCDETSPVVKAEPIDTEQGQLSVSCDETSPVVKSELIDTGYEQQQIAQISCAQIKVEPTDDYFDKLEDDIQATGEKIGKEKKETKDLNENQSLQIKESTIDDIKMNEIFVESLVVDIKDEISSKNCTDEFVFDEHDKWNVLDEIVDETVAMLSSDQAMNDMGGQNPNLVSQGHEVNKQNDENIEQFIADQEIDEVNDENNNKENLNFNKEYLNLTVTVDNDYRRNSKDLESWETADEETNNQPASILDQEQDKKPGPGFSNHSKSKPCPQLQKDNDTALEVDGFTSQRHVCYPHRPLYPINVPPSDYTSAVSYSVQPGFSTQVNQANFNFSRQQQQLILDVNLSQQASSVDVYADKAFSEDQNSVALCERTKQKTNDNMLENLKRNELPNLQLQDITGHVVEFLLDSAGSQFVLSKLPRAAREETSIIVNEILTSGQIITLCKSPSGYHVLQKLLMNTSEQSHCLAMKLFGNIVQLSLHPYGSKIIVQALSTSHVQIQKGILKELERSVLHCITDSIGNHVIQKCIEIFSPQCLRTIIETCKDQLTILCTHIHGSQVLQKLITHCVLWRTKPIREAILDQSDVLVQDPNGVEVIMCVLQKGTPEDKNRILNWLKGDLLSHSVQRFNSYLVETCLTCLQPDQKAVLIKEVCLMNDIAFRTILTDRYASSIVQRMIEVAKPHQRRVLVMKIQPYRSTLSNSYLWKDAAVLNTIEN